MSALTAAEIHREIAELKPRIAAALAALEDVNGRIPRASYEYETEYNTALITAKSNKSTDTEAKAKAALVAADKKLALDDLLAIQRQRNAEVRAWQEVVRAFVAESYALQQELKFAQGAA